MAWEPAKEHDNIAASASEARPFGRHGLSPDHAWRTSKHGGELAACLKECCILEDKGNNIYFLDAVEAEK